MSETHLSRDQFVEVSIRSYPLFSVPQTNHRQRKACAWSEKRKKIEKSLLHSADHREWRRQRSEVSSLSHLYWLLEAQYTLIMGSVSIHHCRSWPVLGTSEFNAVCVFCEAQRVSAVRFCRGCSGGSQYTSSALTELKFRFRFRCWFFIHQVLQQWKCLESGKHTNISKQQHWPTSTSNPFALTK